MLLGGCSQEPAGSSAPMPPEKVLKVVKDRKDRHTARVVQRGAKQVVIRDGKPGPEYDQVSEVAFSADGRSLAYEARKGKHHVVVLDDQEWPLEAEVVQGSFKMSPDNKRLALVASANHKWQVMVDGHPDPPFDFIFPETLKFSPNSNHTGYLALKGEKLQVVVDGQVLSQMNILSDGSKALKEFLSQAEDADAAQDEGEKKE